MESLCLPSVKRKKQQHSNPDAQTSVQPTLQISTYLTLQGQTQHSEAPGPQILNPASSVQISCFHQHVISVFLSLLCSFLFSVSEQSQMLSFTVSSARLNGVHPYVVNQTVCLVCVITGETQAHQGVAHMVWPRVCVDEVGPDLFSETNSGDPDILVHTHVGTRRET